LAGFIYETRFSRFSPFPVNGLTTFYHCSDDRVGLLFKCFVTTDKRRWYPA